MDPCAPKRLAFKKCPLCGFCWDTRGDFLADPRVTMIGYQACLTDLTAGYFLFNHTCEGTLAVVVEEFVDLYAGPIYQERAIGTVACPQYCLHQDELARCPATCECAFVREIIQRVRAWNKNPIKH